MTCSRRLGVGARAAVLVGGRLIPARQQFVPCGVVGVCVTGLRSLLHESAHFEDAPSISPHAPAVVRTALVRPNYCCNREDIYVLRRCSRDGTCVMVYGKRTADKYHTFWRRRAITPPRFAQLHHSFRPSLEQIINRPRRPRCPGNSSRSGWRACAPTPPPRGPYPAPAGSQPEAGQRELVGPGPGRQLRGHRGAGTRCPRWWPCLRSGRRTRRPRRCC